MDRRHTQVAMRAQRSVVALLLGLLTCGATPPLAFRQLTQIGDLIGAMRQKNEAANVARLVALWNIAGNLGYATIRASYAVADEPVTPAAAAWIERDFTTAFKWAETTLQCFPFDLSRLQNAASLVRSTKPPSRELWQLADQMHRDFRATVQRSGCTLGLATHGDLDTFYNTALFMGFATARASYFYYDTPIPREVVNQIVSDFGVIRRGLPVIDRCTNARAAAESQLQAVERVLGTVAGKQSYTQIANIYVAIEEGLKSGNCAEPPLGSPAGTGASCQATTCANECKNAMSMLGVISGPPECVACMKEKCP